MNVDVITLKQTPRLNQMNIDLEASIRLAMEMEWLVKKNYCTCKVTSVLRYKHNPTDDQPSAYAIELEADYSKGRIEEEVGIVKRDDVLDLLWEMMSNGPYKIRVITDGKQIFDARHFDDHIVEMNHRFP